jgi:hypothetical protein
MATSISSGRISVLMTYRLGRGKNGYKADFDDLTIEIRPPQL